MKMKRYILGADTLKVFTDAGTVKYTQQALAALPAAKIDPVFQIKADGIIGPKTQAAVYKFNVQYRGEPGDGSNITEGTLTALKLSPLAAPVELKPAEMAMVPSGVPGAVPTVPPVESQESFLERDAFGGLKVWQVIMGAVGIAAVGTGLYMLATSGKPVRSMVLRGAR